MMAKAGTTPYRTKADRRGRRRYGVGPEMIVPHDRFAPGPQNRKQQDTRSA